ncbi:MAG: GTP-binding protein [Eubacteriales bacterium]|nr:GTP-binding protein [Eubacteriales bacterium]
MEQAAPIRLYLINGFLGSGKTTFMRALIDSFQGTRLGVLVNEFGSIGIDGTLVQKEGIRLVEVNRGSIFCACIKDGFIRTLKAFSQQPIDTLLIESSGMADPAGMAKILEGLASHLDRKFQYAGSICLVDCTSFADYADILMPLQNQVASADFIIVNKLDLVNAEQLEEVHKLIRHFNSDAPVYDTAYAQVPQSVLQNDLRNRGYIGEGTNAPYNRPNTYTLLSDAKLTEEQLRRFCELLSGKVFRYKGFLRSTEKGFWHVEGVGEHYSIEPASFRDGVPPQNGRIVCIAFDNSRIAAEVESAWSASVPEYAQKKTTLEQAAPMVKKPGITASVKLRTNAVPQRNACPPRLRAPRDESRTAACGGSGHDRAMDKDEKPG